MVEHLVELKSNLAQFCNEKDKNKTDKLLICRLRDSLESEFHSIVPDDEDVDALFLLLEKAIVKLAATNNSTDIQILCFHRMMQLAASTKKLPKSLDIGSDIEPLPEDAEPVAEGGFGKVYKTSLNSDGKAVAVKTPKKSIKDKIKSMFREILLWNRLDNPHILTFLGVCTFRKKYPALVSRWMDKGTLSHNSRTLSLEKKYILLSQVASALDYLHNHKPQVIHEDIRGDNILISDSGQALLSDFGISRINERAFVDMSTKIQYGNARWLAPELLFGREGRYPKPHSAEEISDTEEEYLKASEHTDMWSFGMTVMEVLTNKRPFAEYRNEAAAIMGIHTRALPKRPIITDENGNIGPPQDLWSGIEQCWHEDPEERPSALEMEKLLKRAGRGKSAVIVQLREAPPLVGKRLIQEAYASSSVRS